MNAIELKNKLDEIHINKGISLTFIANRLGVSRNSLYMARNGHRALGKDRMQQLQNIIKEYS